MQSEAVILGTFAVCVFLFLSNFHICGMLGDMFSSMLLGVFGSIGYVAPVLLFLGTIFYASNKGNIRAVYKMLAVGLGMEYVVQVFLTVGGVTKFIPSTGVTLPFVSYGGSSIVTTFLLFSIIQGLYIIKRNDEEEMEEMEAQEE